MCWWKLKRYDEHLRTNFGCLKPGWRSEYCTFTLLLQSLRDVSQWSLWTFFVCLLSRHLRFPHVYSRQSVYLSPNDPVCVFVTLCVYLSHSKVMHMFVTLWWQYIHIHSSKGHIMCVWITEKQFICHRVLECTHVSHTLYLFGFHHTVRQCMVMHWPSAVYLSDWRNV